MCGSRLDPNVDKSTVKAIIEALGGKGVVHRAVGDRGGRHCVILAKLDLASPQNPFPEVVLGQKRSEEEVSRDFGGGGEAAIALPRWS